MPSDPNRRPDKVVCRTCEHFREKNDTSRRWPNPGRPPGDWKKECMWFHTREGSASSSSERMGVMLASANGGVDCKHKRQVP